LPCDRCANEGENVCAHRASSFNVGAPIYIGIARNLNRVVNSIEDAEFDGALEIPEQVLGGINMGLLRLGYVTAQATNGVGNIRSCHSEKN